MPKTINIKTANANYPIIIERNLIKHLNKYINKSAHVFIITDENVAELYLKSVILQFENYDSYIIKPGEDSKDINTIMNIIKKLYTIKADRKTLIIALGGGVVGDIAGLVASLYMRGINYINIATSTLSQVDSSVGGKVAINFNDAKNLVGSFYQPSLVLIDPNVLKTLNKREYYSGLIEAVKMAIISNEKLFKLILEEDIEKNITKIIYEAILIKAKIVEQDEFDLGIRNLLNFGHTLGHALEVKYKMLHGEAVLLGMLHSEISPELKHQLLEIAKKFDIDTEINLRSDLYEIILNDKKIIDQHINLVKVDEIGKAYLKSYPISYLKELVNAK